MEPRYDAVIVGAGPNGLAASIVLARAGLSTLLIEGKHKIGGGAKSSALTLPGFVHDDCSSIHPMALASPFFKELDLQRYGLRWIESPTPLAHVLNERTTLVLERSLEATAVQFGEDGEAYLTLMRPLVDRFAELMEMAMGPLRWPSHPLFLARFGLLGLRSMHGLAAARFKHHEAPALLAGIAAHSFVPLDKMISASFALVLAAAAHAVGWPMAEYGSQSLVNALADVYFSLGGEIRTEQWVRDLDELPPARAYLLDVSPEALARIAASRLPRGYLRRLRHLRHAPGVYKIDWALRDPIPWRNPLTSRAATVHLSGTLENIELAERYAAKGAIAPRPFILLAQPTLWDHTRAPGNAHTAWAYCHVPFRSSADAHETIEAHIEHYAPGFRERILARHTRDTIALEQHDPNLVGGDISGGVPDMMQLFFRPVARLDPYATPAPNVFLCSSSTPPGGGVHGMCGYFAAQSCLRRLGVRPRAVA